MSAKGNFVRRPQRDRVPGVLTGSKKKKFCVQQVIRFIARSMSLTPGTVVEVVNASGHVLVRVQGNGDKRESRLTVNGLKARGTPARVNSIAVSGDRICRRVYANLLARYEE